MSGYYIWMKSNLFSSNYRLSNFIDRVRDFARKFEVLHEKLKCLVITLYDTCMVKENSVIPVISLKHSSKSIVRLFTKC